MKKITIKQVLPIAGNLFVFGVAVFVAFQVKEVLLKVILIVSAIVSLILAIVRLCSTWKIQRRIEELEDTQPSFSVEGHTLKIGQGK